MLRRRWTVVGDAVLHSRETATAWHLGARPFVFVHGVGTTSRYARPVLRALAEHHPAVAVELPGIGSSSAPELPGTIGDQADVLAEWVRVTGRWPTTFVGNSMGAQTAVEIGVRHPELVERLVLIGPTVEAGDRGFLHQAGALLVDATRERPSLLALTATDSVLTRRRAVAQYLRASLAHRIEERIALVQAPVLVVRGERDPMVSRRWARQLAGRAPRGTWTDVPGAAHACHHGRPDAVAALLAGAR